MKLTPARLGAERTGSLADKDNKWLKEHHVEPDEHIVLWVCEAGDDHQGCGADKVAIGYLDPARRQTVRGQTTTHDQRTCPGCGRTRQPYAVLTMVKIDHDAFND